MTTVDVRLLGPLRVSVDGSVVAIPSAKQRALVAMLVLGGNQATSIAALIDAVWGEPPPERAEHTLQQHVSVVRKLLEAAAPGGDDRIIKRQSPGYLLRIDHLDASAFEDAAATGNGAMKHQEWTSAIEAFDAALASWRGADAALADVRLTPRLDAAGARLDERRLTVIEARGDAQLAAGRTSEVVSELEHLVARHPRTPRRAPRRPATQPIRTGLASPPPTSPRPPRSP